MKPCADPQGCVVAELTPNQFGPRDYKQYSDTYRIRTGFEGTFGTSYNWELGYVYQRNDTTENIYNSGNWQHLAQATGQAPCVDVPGGCSDNAAFGYKTPTTPFNFFNGVNTFTPEQIKYLTYDAVDTNYSNENYVYGNVTGPLFHLPAGDVKGSTGFEIRSEYLADNPDSLFQQGLGAGTAAATAGGYRVSSVYGELQIPVLKDVPFAESVNFTASGRYDHYSTFGDAQTWKLGLNWQVIPDIRFRGSYSTGFRAPTVSELYGGNVVSYLTVDGDPCDSRAPGFNKNSNAGTGSLAPGSACFTSLTKLGLTPAQIATYQSPENNLQADQRGTIIGGNPELKPELSRSWNAGFVLTPTFLRGFSFDADYYDIKITNSILTGGFAGAINTDFVVNGCYVQQNPLYCSLITRTSSGVFQINSLNANFGLQESEGLDLEMTYSTAASGLTLPVPGAFTFNIVAEREFTNTQQNPDGTTTQYVGFFNTTNESIQPKWKGQISAAYHLANFTFHYDGQYIGKTHDLGGTPAVFGDRIPPYIYHDISVLVNLPPMMGALPTFTVGINNLMDKDPPFLTGDSVCKCNSLAGPYDFAGRTFFSRLSAKF